MPTIDAKFRRDLYERSLKVAEMPLSDVEAYLAAEKAIYAEWDALRKAAGPGTQVNRIVRFSHADGYAVYVIAHVGLKTCTLLHLPFGDAYRSPAVSKNETCPRSTVDQQVANDDMWATAIQKCQDENSRFFDGLTVGQVVHYNSSDGWIRCKVVDGEYELGGEKGRGKSLLAITPVGVLRHQDTDGRWVGDWSQGSMYTVSPSGEVRYGYQINKIKEGKAFRCHATDVFEFQRRLRPFQSDPTTAPELAYEPPAPSEADLTRQAQFRVVETIRAILGESGEPLDLLRRVHATAAGALSQYS